MARATLIVGTGAVARAFATKLRSVGTRVALISRQGSSSPAAAMFPCLSFDEAELDRAQLLLAVPDDAVTDAAARLSHGATRGGIALHTAGCLDRTALQPLLDVGFEGGSLHPLASVVPDDPASLEGSWFGMEGDDAAVRWGRQLAALWGGQIVKVDPGCKALYHAAAVTASNHLVALLDSALDLMVAAGVEPEDARTALCRLAGGAVDNVERLGPCKALTGPLRRGDVRTLERHLEAVCGLSEESFYRSGARRTLQLARSAGYSPTACDEARTLICTGEGAARGSDG